MQQEKPDVGKKIRAERERLGLSIGRLAELAEIDRDTLTSIETGLRRGKPYVRGPSRGTTAVVQAALAQAALKAPPPPPRRKRRAVPAT